jgi:hypothetical protein
LKWPNGPGKLVDAAQYLCGYNGYFSDDDLTKNKKAINAVAEQLTRNLNVINDNVKAVARNLRRVE